MKTQIVFDPLTQPVEVYADLLKGISENFKNWLKELGAGRNMTSRHFDLLESRAEDLFRVPGMAEEQKAQILFRGSEALRCFDPEKLEAERLKIIPALFFREYGIFYHYVGDILPDIKRYAEKNPSFREKYEAAKTTIRENSSAAGRVEMYLHSANPYPPNLIAELEEITEPCLAPELLPFLYWGKEVYLLMHRLYRGGTGKDLYRKIPRWNCGNYAPLPFIGYAAIKKDVNMLRAVFEGTEPVEAMRILVRLFYANSFHDKYRCFANWLDQAIVQDFYEEHLDQYRECRGLLINPDEEDKAELFLEYAAELLGQDTPDTALPMVQTFFSAAAPEESQGITAYLNYIEGMEKNETAYWRLFKLVVDRAARFPAAELLPRERFRNYTRGDMGKSAFYLLEMYLNNIKPDRETLILLGAYIYVVFENQRIDTPELLPWLFCCTRFSELCTPFMKYLGASPEVSSLDRKFIVLSPAQAGSWVHTPI